MRRCLDNDTLRTLSYLSNTMSFTETASLIGRTQSTVSQQIARLEKQLGGSIAIRKQGRVEKFTELGSIVLGYGQKILELNDAVLVKASQLDLKGSINLGVPSDVIDTVIPAILGRFKKIYPDVTVNVATTTSAQLLHSLGCGQLDLALIKSLTRPVEIEGTAIDLVYEENLYWFGPSTDSVLFGARSPIPLALFPEGCAYRNGAVEALESSGKNFNVSFVSPSSTAIRMAVANGLGITALPKSALQDGMTILDESAALPALPTAGIYFAAAPKNTSEHMQCFGSFLLEELESPSDL